jgi:hypothetical protein
MMKHLPLVFAALFVAYTFLPPRPVVETGPVTTALASASSSDRAKVAGIYRALADVTARDQGKQIGSTSVWRVVHSNTLRLAVGGSSLVGKYQGLDKAVEEVLSQSNSLDNLSLTAESNGQPVWKNLEKACLEIARQAGG